MINLLSERPLDLAIYDLAGHRLFATEQEAQAGHQEFHWDGRDQHGSLVPAGLYLAEIRIASDVGDHSLRWTLAIAY